MRGAFLGDCSVSLIPLSSAMDWRSGVLHLAGSGIAILRWWSECE